MTNEELKNIIVEELHQLQEKEKVIAKKILFSFNPNEKKVRELQEKLYMEIADNIVSKLPEQIITEDRIIEVLNSFHAIINPKYSYKQIAHEILQTQGWESIGEVKITEENIDNAGYWLKEYKGKNIEIAVKIKGE